MDLAKNLDKIVNDEYGNFVVQIIVNMKITEVNDIVYEYLTINLQKLSMKKYSSNVIDKVRLELNINSAYYSKKQTLLTEMGRSIEICY